MRAFLKGAVIPLALVAAWQLSANLWGITSDTLAAPADIVVAFVAALGAPEFWRAMGQTLLAAAAGLFIGAAAGLITGVAFGLLPPLSRIMRLTVEVLRPLPAIAIVPIAILVFGFGYMLEIAIVAFATFFPVMILSEAAVGQVHPRLIEVARVLRLGTIPRLGKIVLPAILPRSFVALRLAAGLALVVAITVEVAANPLGLGSRLMQAAGSLRPADMFATLLWIALLGWGVNSVLVLIERSLFPDLKELTR